MSVMGVMAQGSINNIINCDNSTLRGAHPCGLQDGSCSLPNQRFALIAELQGVSLIYLTAPQPAPKGGQQGHACGHLVDDQGLHVLGTQLSPSKQADNQHGLFFTALHYLPRLSLLLAPGRNGWQDPAGQISHPTPSSLPDAALSSPSLHPQGRVLHTGG